MLATTYTPNQHPTRFLIVAKEVFMILTLLLSLWLVEQIRAILHLWEKPVSLSAVISIASIYLLLRFFESAKYSFIDKIVVDETRRAVTVQHLDLLFGNKREAIAFAHCCPGNVEFRNPKQTSSGFPAYFVLILKSMPLSG